MQATTTTKTKTTQEVGMSPLLGPDQVAHKLGISKRTLARLVSTKQAPPSRLVGRQRRWRIQDVAKFAAATE